MRIRFFNSGVGDRRKSRASESKGPDKGAKLDLISKGHRTDQRVTFAAFDLETNGLSSNSDILQVYFMLY